MPLGAPLLRIAPSCLEGRGAARIILAVAAAAAAAAEEGMTEIENGIENEVVEEESGRFWMSGLLHWRRNSKGGGVLVVVVGREQVLLPPPHQQGSLC